MDLRSEPETTFLKRSTCDSRDVDHIVDWVSSVLF